MDFEIVDLRVWIRLMVCFTKQGNARGKGDDLRGCSRVVLIMFPQSWERSLVPDFSWSRIRVFLLNFLSRARETTTKT
jgi:hypothetical protein